MTIDSSNVRELLKSRFDCNVCLILLYIYCFLCTYSYLTCCRASEWMLLINPATYILAVLTLPLAICKPYLVFLWKVYRFRLACSRLEEPEDDGPLADIVMDVLGYESKLPEESTTEQFNNMILANDRPDKGPENQFGEDVCSVWTHGLAESDILIKTKWNHVFHLEWLRNRLKAFKHWKDWNELVNFEEE